MLSQLILKLKIHGSLSCVLYALCGLQMSYSQISTANSEVKSVLQLSDADQTRFVSSVLDRGFPGSDGDRFSILLVNRSALVIPIIESRIEEELKRLPVAERFVELASAMIAYSGDEESLKAIERLIVIDQKRFQTLVGLTLDNALNWRNPFTLAYRVLLLSDAVIERETLAWVDSNASSIRMQRLWADAVMGRYGKAPTHDDWLVDPLASRSQSTSVKEHVLELTKQQAEKKTLH